MKSLSFILQGIVLSLLGSLFQACSHKMDPIRIPASEVPNNLAWNRYVQNNILQRPYPIMEGCEARRIVPPQGVVATHKILLVHGFTACPQQFHDWAEELSRKGVVVYLFLLPGHGFRGPEEHKFLPSGQQGLQKLQELEGDLIQVARGDSLPTTVGGLSVGAAVATAALLRSPASFDRGLFFTPYFEAGNQWVRLLHQTVGGVLNVITGERETSWGPSCLEEQRLGRAGICSFRLKHLQTINEYGSSVMRNARSLVHHIQFVGVEGDEAAHNGAIAQMAQRLGRGVSPRAHACFYRKGANHSLISRFDSPKENKFWKPALIQDATGFVLHGRPFREIGASTERGFRRCSEVVKLNAF